MTEGILDALERLEKSVEETRAVGEAVQREASSVAQRIIASCPQRLELRVFGQINPHTHPPLPTDQGGTHDDRTHYDFVEYTIKDGTILTREGLPVDASVADAEVFLRHCEIGLIELIRKQVKDYIRRGAR